MKASAASIASATQKARSSSLRPLPLRQGHDSLARATWENCVGIWARHDCTLVGNDEACRGSALRHHAFIIEHPGLLAAFNDSRLLCEDLRQQGSALYVSARPANVADGLDCYPSPHARSRQNIFLLRKHNQRRRCIFGKGKIPCRSAAGDLDIDDPFAQPVTRDQLPLDLAKGLRGGTGLASATSRSERSNRDRCAWLSTSLPSSTAATS